MKKLIYKVFHEINTETGESPVIEREMRGACAVSCDSNFEEVYAFVKAEAYNGEVTVEDAPEPEPTADEILNAMLGVTE